jgi:hypothetical protein
MAAPAAGLDLELDVAELDIVHGEASAVAKVGEVVEELDARGGDPGLAVDGELGGEAVVVVAAVLVALAVLAPVAGRGALEVECLAINELAEVKYVGVVLGGRSTGYGVGGALAVDDTVGVVIDSSRALGAAVVLGPSR